MAIFHLSIRPISRAKGHSAVAQIAYDTRCKLTNERTGEKLDWSKHKQDVIQWQTIGPNMQPGELAARAERAENRSDARVGRAMDVALPSELSTKAQWDLLRGFGLQLRDTYGAALCVSLHHPNGKGDQRNVHGHIFMTSRAVDEEGNFSKRKMPSFRGTRNWRSSPKASSGAKVRRGSKARSFSPTCQTTSSIGGSPAIPLQLCL
jgi:hypothetical protein